ncbi:MAG: thioredoxin family protein [Desulfobacterales bacterium]|nr:MAG: thioredoxin family protein [Desulfobacterales bacterium]
MLLFQYVMKGNSMFSALEERLILKLNEQLSRDITIRLVDSAHPSSPAFHKFCDDLNHLVPSVKISKEKETDTHPPQIQIGSGLRYQTVPTGHELQPFLEALITFDSGSDSFPEAVKSNLKKDNLPASLVVFIAPQCTFCPTAVRQLTPLPMVNDKIQLIIIDGTLFPEEAESQKIQVVPTILLDEQFRWTGSVPLEEIIDTINTRDPSSLGALSLENILKEGQAGHLAAMMLNAGQIFPAFYDLLTHHKWPVRLGAMVVLEEIAGRNRAMAAEAINFLWEGFYRQLDQVKGDILYMFGEIGNPCAVAWLEEVLAGEYNEEVKEAAKEAIEKLPKMTKMR